jgi:hypothetical protein
VINNLMNWFVLFVLKVVLRMILNNKFIGEIVIKFIL